MHERSEESSALDNPKIVRAIARIIFMAMFLYIAIVASRCYAMSAKLRLLRYGRIPILETAGWLSGDNILSPLTNVHRIPNFGWWLIMLILIDVYQLAEFATNTINDELQLGECPFRQGIILNPEPVWKHHYWNGPSQRIASNAQLYSLFNSPICAVGIYRKANNDPFFCAGANDTMGSWTCDGGLDVNYSYREGDSEVVNNLAFQGLLDRLPYRTESTDI